MRQWKEYHQRVAEKPNSLVENALEKYVIGRSAVLDLGAGNLRDTKFLLNFGFECIVGVDKSNESQNYLVPGIELHILPIEQYQISSNSFNLIVSCNTLFFIDASEIKLIFERVFQGLRRDGIFVCNVLGEEDEWVVEGRSVSCFTKTMLLSLCADFQVLNISDVNYHTLTRPKHWHLWNISVAKR